MSEARIWYNRDLDQQTLPGDCQNTIVLSDEFYEEITNHPIPTDLEAAKALSCAPAALDLFTWLTYRCYTADGPQRVPLFVEAGLIHQLGSAEYSRPRKFREKLEGWLDLVRALWPESPAKLSGDREYLLMDRGFCHSSDETCCLRRPVFCQSHPKRYCQSRASLGAGRLCGTIEPYRGVSTRTRKL